MKHIIREYLTFSNSDKKGVIVLLILIVALSIAPHFLWYFQEDSSTDFSAFEREISGLKPLVSSGTLSDTNRVIPNSKVSAGPVVLYNFNPNHLPEAQWRQLGLNTQQISNLKKYENRGGVFRKKEDLKKIYGISQAEFLRLEPYIKLQVLAHDSLRSEKVVWKERVSREKLRIPINTADSATFTLLKGIGPVYAARIIKYRNRLGGFCKMEQLREVYGMDSTLFALIFENLLEEPLAVKKININAISIEELRKHPYFTYKIAGLIVNYRQSHGSYKDPSEIKNIVLINDVLYVKLAPYITIE